MRSGTTAAAVADCLGTARGFFGFMQDRENDPHRVRVLCSILGAISSGDYPEELMQSHLNELVGREPGVVIDLDLELRKRARRRRT